MTTPPGPDNPWVQGDDSWLVDDEPAAQGAQSDPGPTADSGHSGQKSDPGSWEAFTPPPWQESFTTSHKWKGMRVSGGGPGPSSGQSAWTQPDPGDVSGLDGEDEDSWDSSSAPLRSGLADRLPFLGAVASGPGLVTLLVTCASAVLVILSTLQPPHTP